jgi:oligopeptide transport system substrate-binding protein
MEMVYVPDAALALEAYEAGDLDTLQVDSSQIPAIQADPTLSAEYLAIPGTNTAGLFFDMKRPPFDEKAVREAFAYAFDRETWCQDVRNGDCVPTTTWVPAGVPGSIASDAYAFDPDKARQALAASSYGGPDALPPIEYVYVSDIPEEKPRAEWIAGQYRDILGVELTLVPMEQKAWVSSINDPENFPQLTGLGWIQDYPDPQNWLSLLWSCGAFFANTSGYCNPEFDELVQTADQSLDPETRIGIYEEAHHLLLADVPAVFTGNDANVFLVKPYVSGYQTTPSDVEWPGEWASALTLDVERPA